jgi:hypothetical protein
MIEDVQIGNRVAKLYQVSKPKNSYEFFHGVITDISDSILVQFDDGTIYNFNINDDTLINIPSKNQTIYVLWEDANNNAKYYRGTVINMYTNAYKIKYDDGETHTHELTERSWQDENRITKLDTTKLTGDLLLQREQAANWLHTQKTERLNADTDASIAYADYHTKMNKKRSPKKEMLARMYLPPNKKMLRTYQNSDDQELESILINDGFEKSGPTIEYEFEWLNKINNNFINLDSQITDEDIQNKINEVLQYLPQHIQNMILSNNITSLPERINPFVQVFGYDGDILTLEKVGNEQNQVRNWLNSKTNEERQRSSYRLLFYLSYALLLMERNGENHNDLTNPDNVHILGQPNNLYIKIFDPKVFDEFDTKPDIEGIVNIINLTFQDGSLSKPPPAPTGRKKRKSSSRLSNDSDDDDMFSRSRRDDMFSSPQQKSSSRTLF